MVKTGATPTSSLPSESEASVWEAGGSQAGSRGQAMPAGNSLEGFFRTFAGGVT